jgi:hypothetical protein
VRGAIETIAFVGDHLDCRVRIQDQATLSLSVPRSMAVAEGADIVLRMSPARATVWPV